MTGPPPAGPPAQSATSINRATQTDLLRQTIQTGKPRTLRDLTCEEARQAIENIRGFFRMLQQWDSDGRREAERPRFPNKVQEP